MSYLVKQNVAKREMSRIEMSDRCRSHRDILLGFFRRARVVHDSVVFSGRFHWFEQFQSD